MSQKSEKHARRLGCRMDKLESDMKQLRQAQGDSDCFTAVLHSISNETAVQRRRVREKDHLAREWRRVAWLSLIAFVLCATAALCLTIKVKANADKPVVITDKLAEPVSPAQCWEAPDIPELDENANIQAALLAKANVIQDCTVTWYTSDTCGKQPGDPAYGITYSGLPVVEHLTCAVDPDVIPLYSDVFVQYADGRIEQLWATDTGVTGNAVDIYTPDYDYAIQCGRQSLTVWWVAPEEASAD